MDPRYNREMLRDCLRGVLDLMEDLFINARAQSENVSYSQGLVAILVLTLIGVKSNLGFRHDVVGLLSKFSNSRTM